MNPEDIVAVEVPASCANLGPGFDALAAAVDRHLVASITDRTDRRIVPGGEGADELPTDDTNLVWRCFVAYCERFGSAVPDVSLDVRSEIPLERGLGSSAAAAVAGVALARAVVRAGGSDQDVIDIAAQMEGHADNAAAAVLGGIVACGDGSTRRFEPAPALRPVLCIPQGRQSTTTARAVLPSEVPLAVAAANGARTALVLAGLTGGCAFDAGQMVDSLHEPSRFVAMPESGRLVGALREAGIGACLSGAGPTVLAIGNVADTDVVDRVRLLAGPEWHVEASAWDRAGVVTCPPTVVPR